MKRTPRGDRGVAAVEAGLVLSFLVPLLGGLLVYGNYFWQAQKVDAYAPRIAQDSFVGQFTCADLIDRVTAEAAAQLKASGTGGDQKTAAASSVEVTVVEVVPGEGVTVRISIKVPVTKSFGAILPNDGNVVSEVTKRLENVTVTTQSCP